MPATKLTAKPVADALTEKITAQVAELKTKGVNTTLAILRVGERADDLSYEKGALKRAETCGVNVKQVVLPEDVSRDALLGAVADLNSDKNVHGVLVFRPLPYEADVFAALAPEKDIDGATDANTARLFNGYLGTVFGGGTGPVPENSALACTPAGMLAILDYYGYGDVKGKKVAFVGAGLRVGRPLGMILLNRGATITYCHEFTPDAPAICRDADILVTAVGKAKLIGEKHMKPGQVIIDAGLSVGADGKMVGDTDADAAETVGVSYTPSVGAMTTAILMAHVVDAAVKTLK
jgi:methylenetetrahydrofolate dehydrogenase (NADP+)/methenyltetrahydrofolate cyclohydrolase